MNSAIYFVYVESPSLGKFIHRIDADSDDEALKISTASLAACKVMSGDAYRFNPDLPMQSRFCLIGTVDDSRAKR